MDRKFFTLEGLDKFEELPDGNLIVPGIVATDALDNDQQRLDPDWLKQALPEWFDTAANVRAQHPKGPGVVAAGIGLDLNEIEPGKWHLKALVVDEDAKAKVRAGVYKGFSVGMKGLLVDKGDKSVPNGWIRGGRIVEVSLVDRPCNDETMFDKADSFVVAKADGDDGPLESTQITAPDATEHGDGAATQEGAAATTGTPAPSTTGTGDAPAASDADPAAPPASSEKTATPDDRVYSAIQSLEQCVEWVQQAQQDDPDAGTDPNDKAVSAIVAKIVVLIDQLKTAQHKDMAGESGKAELSDAEADELVAKADAALAELWPNLSPGFLKAITADQRKKAAASGAAMSDGSYPVRNKADLANAIKAVGRGNADHDSIRKHIIARAKALGASDEIPDNWNADGSLKKTEIPTTTKSEEDDDMNLLELLGIEADTVTKAAAPDAPLEDRLALYAELQKALGIDVLTPIPDELSSMAETVKTVKADVERIKAMDAEGGPVRTVLTPAQVEKSESVKSIEAELVKMERTATALTNPEERRLYVEAIEEKRTQLRSMQADLPAVPTA